MSKARLIIDLTGDSEELKRYLKEHFGFNAGVGVFTFGKHFHVRLKESWLHGVIFDEDGFDASKSNGFMITTCDGSCKV